MSDEELAKTYPDKDNDGIPDAFEKPINAVLAEIYDGSIIDLTCKEEPPKAAAPEQAMTANEYRAVMQAKRFAEEWNRLNKHRTTTVVADRAGPMFVTDRNIYVTSQNKPVEKSGRDKQWLLLGAYQSMPWEKAKQLGIIDENGKPFWEQK